MMTFVIVILAGLLCVSLLWGFSERVNVTFYRGLWSDRIYLCEKRNHEVRTLTAERDELNTRLNKASVRIIEMMKERDELLSTINREAEAFKRQTDALAAKEQERSEAACSADGWHDKYKQEQNKAEHRLKLLVAAEARGAELERAMYLDGVGT